jgi:hypothetical protein
MKQIVKIENLGLFLLGALGVSQLWFAELGLADLAVEAGISLPALKLAQMAQVTLFLLLAVIVGAGGSSRTHFRGLRRSGFPPSAVLRDISVGTSIAVILLLGYRYLVSEFVPLEGLAGDSPLLLAVLYGGLTEEVLIRWGVMGFVAYVLLRFFEKDGSHRGLLIVWANLVTAALFALGHFPALSLLPSPQPVHYALVFVFNALIGLIYGWLFARHSLVASMLAHAGTHVGAFVVLSVLA